MWCVCLRVFVCVRGRVCMCVRVIDRDNVRAYVNSCVHTCLCTRMHSFNMIQQA